MASQPGEFDVVPHLVHVLGGGGPPLQDGQAERQVIRRDNDVLKRKDLAFRSARHAN